MSIPGQSPANAPLKRLFGFERLYTLAPGESKSVSFSSTTENLAIASTNGTETVSSGVFGIELGDVVTPATRTLTLAGQPLVVRENAWVRGLPEKPSHSLA